jgi:hypothetical protein
MGFIEERTQVGLRPIRESTILCIPQLSNISIFGNVKIGAKIERGSGVR